MYIYPIFLYVKIYTYRSYTSSYVKTVKDMKILKILFVHNENITIFVTFYIT